MSVYFELYTCRDCKHSVTIGFVGQSHMTPVFCSACQTSFSLQAPVGETLFQSSIAHTLYSFGKKEIESQSKKGRVKNKRRVPGWIDTGLEVPIHEDISQSGEQLFLTYTPIFEQVTCPSCQEMSTLMSYQDYVEHCRQCGSQRMEASEM